MLCMYCMKLENKRDFTIGFNLIVPKIIHKFLQQSPVFISTSSGQKKKELESRDQRKKE